jgi:DNA-binding response OmpR family regulator
MAKILIVDDDVTITELMKALVIMDGHEPTIVNDSLLAVETAHSVNPDLITLDLMMPGLNGFELCRLLRDDPAFVETPIMIISAKDDLYSREKAFAAGAREYLVKPFDVDEFLEKVKIFVKA